MLTPPRVEPPNRVIPGKGFGFLTANGPVGAFGFVTAKAASASESFNPTTLTSNGSIHGSRRR